MPSINDFDAKQTSIVLGNILMAGYGEGDFLVITPNSDDWNFKKGADGFSTRSRTNDDSAEMTLKLMQTAVVNEELRQLRELDRRVGRQYKPLTVEDRLNGSTYTGENCYIKGAPVIALGQESTEIEWTIVIDKLILRAMNTLAIG